jgi:hypothetical protein
MLGREGSEEPSVPCACACTSPSPPLARRAYGMIGCPRTCAGAGAGIGGPDSTSVPAAAYRGRRPKPLPGGGLTGELGGASMDGAELVREREGPASQPPRDLRSSIANASSPKWDECLQRTRDVSAPTPTPDSGRPPRRCVGRGTWRRGRREKKEGRRGNGEGRLVDVHGHGDVRGELHAGPRLAERAASAGAVRRVQAAALAPERARVLLGRVPVDEPRRDPARGDHAHSERRAGEHHVHHRCDTRRPSAQRTRNGGRAPNLRLRLMKVKTCGGRWSSVEVWAPGTGDAPWG